MESANKTLDYTRKLTRTWENVTPEVLQSKIIPEYKPAILKNAVAHWDILKASTTPEGSYQYLQTNKISDPEISLFIGQPQIRGRYFYAEDVFNHNFTSQRMKFSEAIETIYNYSKQSNGPTAYAGSIELKELLPEFIGIASMPLIDKQYSARIWAGNSSQVSLHFDQQDNIACLVSGKREFMLIPPDQIANVYVGPLDKSIAGPPTSMVNIDNPDFEKHPKFKTALESAEFAILEPGDALYIPSLWWHSVKSMGEFCLLINYWWDNPEFKIDNAMHSLLHALYTISHLPEGEREAWRHLFDYFVFQKSGAPLTYLPENQRGVLGKMTPNLYRIIKSYVLKNMFNSY